MSETRKGVEHFAIGEIAIHKLTQERVIVAWVPLGGGATVRRKDWTMHHVQWEELEKCGQDTGE